MKNFTFLMKGIFTLCFLFGAHLAQAQVEFRIIPGEGMRFADVNDNGIGINPSMYYDFATGTLTSMEPQATGLSAINNNGEVAGQMIYDQNQGLMQPAYKKDGTWYPIGWFPDADPAESSFYTYAISPNGKYVTGQMSKGCCEYGTFLFDTETGELFDVFSPDGEPLTGYTVTNEGIMGGWLNQPGGGTLRAPVYFNKEGDITTVPEDQLPTAIINAVAHINGNGMMVGDFNGQPFIYDSVNDVFTSYATPQGNAGVFTHISDNGVAIGYEEVDLLIREAIIYHPILGDHPLFLKDVLSNFGVAVPTFDGKMGTAISISPNGNYVVGWVNGSTPYADGWIINFDDLLLQDSECDIICPDDIEVTAVTGETSVVVDYEITFECDDETPPGTEIVLVNGLESGSAFPIGENSVFHRLVDGDGNVLDACSFIVKVNDYYCTSTYDENVEPITYVNFASIDNVSSEMPSVPKNEYFLDITGEVEQGETYPMVLKGFTGGPYTNFFTVFIDWNQDGVFNTSDEKYAAGSISNSTGTDGIEALSNISVPQDALEGITRMRIVKNYNEPGEEPCGSYSYGQTEDYTINVGTLGVNSNTHSDISFYPNPVENTLNIDSPHKIDAVAIFTVTGQKVSDLTLNATNTQVNIASLSSGIYIVKVSSNGQVQNLKLIKK